MFIVKFSSAFLTRQAGKARPDAEHYYDMQKKQFIIYREYYENDRTYDEYIIETIYTKNNLTYVQIYCLADGKMYILSSNYKTN